MSHILNQHVIDREAYVSGKNKDDNNAKDPTEGLLSHAVDPVAEKVIPLMAIRNEGLETRDRHMIILLSGILDELRKMNLHMSFITDEDL